MTVVASFDVGQRADAPDHGERGPPSLWTLHVGVLGEAKESALTFVAIGVGRPLMICAPLIQARQVGAA